MSISAYVGLPGSGKSYGVVANVILPALKAGRTVYTNIPCRSDLMMEDFGNCPVPFDFDDIAANENFFADLPKGIVLVIDELSQLWPSGMTGKQIPDDHKRILSEHRHMVGHCGNSTEVVLLVQDLGMIASYVRILVNTTYKHTQNTAAGLSNKFRCDIYQGPITGPNPPDKNKLNELQGVYRKSVYKYYISHTKSDTGNPGYEKSIDKRTNIVPGLIFKMFLSVSALIFCIYFVSSTLLGFFGSNSSEASESDQPLPEVSKPPSQPVSSPDLPKPQPKPSASFDLLKDNEFYISWNMGRAPDIDYKLRVKSGMDTFTISSTEMENLGYQLAPVNNCLLLIRINRLSYSAKCRAPESKKKLSLDFMGSE